MNTTIDETQEMYAMIRQNRLAMYSSPKRYYNRDGQNGSAFKFLFLVEAIVFLLMVISASSSFAQQNNQNSQMLLASNSAYSAGNISNYSSVYNSGKVFLNWTAKNEPSDCIYIVERSMDGKDYTSVGVKEGIGTEIELFYSWMDETPPDGFAYYRVKKITKDGTQFYTASNAVINMGSSYNPNLNYAQGAGGNIENAK